MKKVVDKHTVAHLFANQSQNEARTPKNNFYFQDDTLYSYGSLFAIAKHVNGSVLFTTISCSVTTSQHISIARHALNHKMLIYCNDPAASVSENMGAFLKEVESVFYNVSKAKQQRTKIKAFSDLAYITDKVNKFATFFDLNVQNNYPKLYEALNTNFEGLNDYKEKAAKLDEAKKKADLKAQSAKHKEQLKKWRSGEISTLYIRDSFDYLRFNGFDIRTSQGVHISINEAKLLYNNLNSNLVGKKVDNKYEITEINNKFISIGCHKITIKEIKKLAASLGW